MIFVTLGTQDKSFKRLLDAVQKEIDNKNIKDKVVVQAGHTKYESKDMEIFDYISMDNFNKLMSECDILITHGGVGSIIEGLKNNKVVIAAARLKEFGEHTNDHQIQIIEEFSDNKYLIQLNDFDKLDEALAKAKMFKQKKYNSNTLNMINTLDDYIKNTDNKVSIFRIVIIILLILGIIFLVALGLIMVF